MQRSILIFLFTIFVSFLNGQAYTITSYNSNVSINRDGSADIHELIEVNFNEERRGIIREIPSKVKIGGKSKSIRISDVHVVDYNYKVYSEGNNKYIRIGDEDIYLTGSKTYELSYKVKGFFIFEDDHTSFQYNVLSNWDCPVEKLNYSIELPEDIDIRYNNYYVVTGQDGANQRNASIQKDGMIINGASYNPLKPFENVSVFIKLPLESIDRPIPPVPIFKRDKTWIAPFAFLLWFLSYFRRKSTLPQMDLSERYFPPENFSPAEVGAYYDNKVNIEDLIALLPYWGNQGYVQVLGTEGTDDPVLYFKKIKDLPSNAPEYQSVIFKSIFEDGDLVILSELKNKIYSGVSSASSKIKKRLIDKELYDQEHYRLFHSGKMIALSVLFIGAAVLLFIKSFILSGIASVIVGIVIFTVHFWTPKRSEKGIEL